MLYNPLTSWAIIRGNAISGRRREIFFSPNQDKKPTNDIYSNRLNGVIYLKDKQVTTKGLAKAQQVLQLNFFRHNPPDTVTVRDVIISNISYLGYMSKEIFEDFKIEEPKKEEKPKKISKKSKK